MYHLVKLRGCNIERGTSHCLCQCDDEIGYVQSDSFNYLFVSECM